MRRGANGARKRAKNKGQRVGGTGVLDKMREQLSGARFRWMNEQLYKCRSGEALEMVRKDPQSLRAYHEGFKAQTEKWPKRPVDAAVEWLSNQPKTISVVDMGAGDGELAQRAEQSVRSFDLAALNEGVEECDIAELPLQSNSVDACVLCLALMGTNYGDFLAGARPFLLPWWSRRSGCGQEALADSVSRGGEGVEGRGESLPGGGEEQGGGGGGQEGGIRWRLVPDGIPPGRGHRERHDVLHYGPAEEPPALPAPLEPGQGLPAPSPPL